MIDLRQVCPSRNKYVDGELKDGRFVEFKRFIPRSFDRIIRQVVTMSNSVGGYIIFGVDDRTRSIVGINGDYRHLIRNLEKVIRELSLGVDYSISHEVVNERDVVILEIKKAEPTSYFSRLKTSPARQIAYRYAEQEGGELSISKEEMRYTKVYKYMTLDAFISSLYSRSLRFFEPSKWNDKYEQRFYCAKYTIPAAIGNTPQLFATCVTRVKNSEAAWKVYSYGQGLGVHCVQLDLDIVELRKQLRESGHRFVEKLVEYKPDYFILNLHKKSRPYYNKYIRAFTLDTFLYLLSLKREAYTYEQEIRLFIIPKNGGRPNKCKNAEYRDVKINWSSIITKVRVDKKCSDSELASIQRACISIGINPVITNYSFIGDLKLPPGLKYVEFERFDIDEMPGPSRITIA